MPDFDEFDAMLYEAIDEVIDGKEAPDVSGADSVTALLDEIKTAEDHLKSLTQKLDGQVEELCATVTTELKRLLPKVDAKLSKGGVIFSYFSRSVGLRPDLEERVWRVEPIEDSARARAMGRALAGDWDGTALGDWKGLVNAIAETLVQKYKTLQGGQVDVPEEKDEPKKKKKPLSDEDIDSAIDNVGAESPTPVNSNAVERKGGSKSPGSTYYA